MTSSEEPKAGSASHSGEKAKKDFLTVGIGASAGGVKALKEFFAGMPHDSGMAFVVVLHLSQTHESNLAGILQRETKMPVVQVTEAVRVEPNHVYVIPPAKGLEMIDGIVRVTQPQRVRGQRVAIDRFFRTLAEAYGSSSVCIVMTGAGEDGTLGLKRVKEENGFAIVQKPEDAEYDQMPRNAIKTGLVDWILPIAEMPRKLLALKESSRELKLTKADEDRLAPELVNVEALREILSILRVRTGHDFTNYKQPTLVRRIARHLQIHELESLGEYAALLRERPDEAQFLLRNLLINVTNFFRDAAAFQSLEEDAIPRLFAGKTAEDQIRVWVAACATGEEAYSIAMLLCEYAGKCQDAPRIQIFASDVDDEAIAAARSGIYPETIVGDVPPDRLRRFFIKEGKSYRVRKELREMILFAPHNILRDPPFSKLDLVTCRNLLIYLNRDTQERLMQLFHFALRPDGFLFLGASESAENLPLLFTPFDKKQRIYLRRPTNPLAQPPLSLAVQDRWETKPTTVVTGAGGRSFNFNELHFNLLEKYAPPSILINEDYDIVHLSQNSGRFLRFAGGEPTNNLLKVVNPDLQADLRAALFTAKQEARTVKAPQIRAVIADAETFVNVTVRPADAPDQTAAFLLVVFEETAAPEKNGGGAVAPIPAPGNFTVSEASDALARHLEAELQRTKDRLRVTVEQYDTSIEELKAANEELQAINEELRSATEELETSKEELQSVNEELTTVNAELKEKIEEVSHVNSDLQNLMHSTDIGTIFLDRELRIKRYTPSASRIFNLIKTDIGRPLEHLTSSLDYKNLGEDARQVLRNLRQIEREVNSGDGESYLARLLPYRTTDDKIDGVVLTFVDITERRRAEEDLRESEMRRHLALDASELGTFLYHPQEDRDEPDERMLALFGLKPGDSLSLAAALDKLIHPDDREYYQAEVAKAFDREGDGKLYAEFRVVHPDKSVHWIAVTGQTIFDGEPAQAVRMYGTAADITERKQAEANLAFLSEVSQDLVELTNIDQTMNRLGEKIGRFFGVKQCVFAEYSDEFKASTVAYGWHAEDARDLSGVYQTRDFLSDELIAALSSGKPYPVSDTQSDTSVNAESFKTLGIRSFITAPLARTGEWRFQISINDDKPRDWRDDEIELLRELTNRIWTRLERARAEEALRESEEKYRTLFDSIDEGYLLCEVIFDENDKPVDLFYIEANPAAVRLAGRDFAGRRMREINPHYEDYWYEIMGRVAKTGETVRAEHYAEPHGRWFDFLASRVGGQESRRVASVFQDITERKESARQQEFLLKFSDALRTPPDKETIEETSLRLLAEFLRLDRAYVFVLYPPEDRAVVRAEQRKENLASLLGEVRMSDFPETVRQIEDQTLVFNDIDSDARLSDLNRTSLASVNLQAFVCTSVRKGERNVIWSLAAASATPRTWTNDEVELIETVGERMWAAAERARAEEALRESEARLNAVFEVLPTGLALADASGRILRFNEAFVRIWGAPPVPNSAAEYAEWKARWVDTGEPLAAEDWAMARTLRTGEVVPGDVVEIERFGGGRVTIINAAAPIRNDAGEVTGGIVAEIDITAQWQAEQALRESKSRLESIANLVPDLLWDSESDGSTNWYNNRWLEYTGQSFEEAIGWGWIDAVHPDDREASARRYREAVEDGEMLRQEHRIRRYDGEYRWFVVSASPLKDKSGKVVKMYGAATDIHEWRLMHEAVRESEERLRVLVENLPGGAVFVVDKNLRYLVAQGEALTAAGFASADLIGRTIAEAMPPEIAGEYELFYQRALGGEAFEREHAAHNRSFISRGVPLKDANGEIYAVLAVSYDITERKRAEEALRESEARFRTMFEQTGIGIVQTSINGEILIANPGFCKIIGCTEAEARSLTVRDITHPDDYEVDMQQARRVLAGEINGYKIEKRYVRKDGSIVWVNLTSTLIRRASGEPFYALAIVEDISERRAAEERLRESEERIRLITETTVDYAIIALDADGIITDWNPGAIKMFGFSEREAVGKPSALIFTPEDRERGVPEKEMQTARETGRAADERYQLRKDGSRFYVSGVMTALKDGNGFAKIARDLSERKEMEEALRNADRRKDEFLATLAHELRNPLAPIRTALEIMRGASNKRKGQHAREIVERQTEQIIHLVDDLLDISRITTGKIKLKKQRLDLIEAVNSAVEATRPAVESFNHELTVKLWDTPIYVDADKTRVAQIVSNLLNNSAKFTENGGKIRLSAEKDGEWAVLRVEDNGIGIAPEQLSRIFDLFAQVEPIGERPQSGLGIGLSLVKKLVEMHDGTIEARSAGEGRGSEFIVRLPLAAEQKPSKQAKKKTVEPAAPPSGASRRVLVVDDNADAADMLRFALEIENHRVHTCYNGACAVDEAAGFEADAVILDIGLPDLDGYEVARRLRARMPEVLLIALSGWGQDEDRKRSAAAGFDHHLVKPVKIEDVTELLAGKQTS